MRFENPCSRSAANIWPFAQPTSTMHADLSGTLRLISAAMSRNRAVSRSLSLACAAGPAAYRDFSE
jgi:hypothetical protein